MENEFGFDGRMSRRRMLQYSAAAIAALGVSGREAFAQENVLRLRAEDTDELELAWYKKVNDAFVSAHPGLEIQADYINAADLFQKITTSLAANDAPDFVAGSSLSRIATLQAVGVLEPVDDVIEKLGKDTFAPGVLERFTFDGKIMGVPRQATPFAFWYRKDVAEKTGAKAPSNWDEYLAFAKAATSDGMFGTVVPAGINTATSKYVFSFMRLNGGNVVDENLVPAIDSPQNRDTLLFLKELSQYSPPGGANFGYADLLNLFVTGVAASTWYSGRVLQRVASRNAAIAPSVAALPVPQKTQPFSYSEPYGAYLFNQGRNLDMAKAWLVEAQYQPENMIEWLLTAPGNQIPLQTTIATDERYTSHELFKSNPETLAVLVDLAATGWSLYRESENHKPNPQAGVLDTGPILPTLMQKVLINNETPEAALAWAQKEVTNVMNEV